MKNLTAVIISFLRPGYTIACIKSLRKRYPGIKIIVAENGERNHKLAKVCNQVEAKYIQMPYDSGVCVARNELVRQVETEFTLVGDDDFYYNDDAKVREMVKFLQGNKDFDLIGGRVRVDGEVKNYQGFIEKCDDHFKSHQLEEKNFDDLYDENSGLVYAPVDLTFNFFVARTAKIKETLWDEKIKVAYEHYSWFYDFKLAGGKVAFTPDAIVIHKPEWINPEEDRKYAGYRNRKEDKARFFKKYGISYTIDMSGRQTYGPQHRAVTTKIDTKYVDFCITTFKRPKAVRRLILSIAKYYPNANVYVADQNEKFDRAFYLELRKEAAKAGLLTRIVFESLPYDCGLSYARNHLVTSTPNMYKLILDDDMEFTPRTDIRKFIQLMQMDNKCGVVGGLVEQLGNEVHFEFNIEKRGDTLYHVNDNAPIREHQGIKYKKTGCVLNFALMRKDLFNYISWDKNLKVTEHLDFYIRMAETPYHILYTPDVMIDHPPVGQTMAGYKDLRQRAEFMVKMLRKHGVKRVKYLNGQVSEIDEYGDDIKRYKEQPE